MEEYKKIISFLTEFGEVLTEHIGNESLSSFGETERTDENIYDRDVSWIDEADLVVAEVSVTSLGVGYEIGYAEAKGKKIICLYEEVEGKRLSAMLTGNKNVSVLSYKGLDDLKSKLGTFIKSL